MGESGLLIIFKEWEHTHSGDCTRKVVTSGNCHLETSVEYERLLSFSKTRWMWWEKWQLRKKSSRSSSRVCATFFFSLSRSFASPSIAFYVASHAIFPPPWQAIRTSVSQAASSTDRDKREAGCNLKRLKAIFKMTSEKADAFWTKRSPRSKMEEREVCIKRCFSQWCSFFFVASIYVLCPLGTIEVLTKDFRLYLY